jgi:hypothetical protein
MANPTLSRTASRAEPSDRSWRIAVVSQPWTVRTAAHFLLRSIVRGPVLAPPWRRHVLRPVTAWQCIVDQVERPIGR